MHNCGPREVPNWVKRVKNSIYWVQFDPVWDLPGTTFGHLGWCNVDRVVSPDGLYTVPTLFHLVPAILGHHGPPGPNKCCFWPFWPSLGPPWDHILVFRVVQCGQNGQSWLPVYRSNLVPPCSSHLGAPWTNGPNKCCFRPFLTHLGQKNGSKN